MVGAAVSGLTAPVMVTSVVASMGFGANGIVVGSAAAEAGVMRGSVIVAVNGRDVSSEPYGKIMAAIRNGSRPLTIEMQSHESSVVTGARQKVEAGQNEPTPQGADDENNAGEDAAPQDQASGTEGSVDERAQEADTRASDGEWNRDEDLQDEPGAATVERLSVAVGGNTVGQAVTRHP